MAEKSETPSQRPRVSVDELKRFTEKTELVNLEVPLRKLLDNMAEFEREAAGYVYCWDSYCFIVRDDPIIVVASW